MPPHPANATRTVPTLHALVASIIDYAGLFPPADLPLDEAIHHYARYRGEPDAWMLARFVIPVRRLEALTPYSGLFAEHPPFRFTVLGTGGPDTEAFLSAFRSDLETIRAFHQRYPGQVRVDGMEVRLPATLPGTDTDTIRAFLDAVRRLAAPVHPGLDLFFEAPLNDALRQHAPAILEAMASHNRDHGERVGFKMRTGGLMPEAFPAPEHLAFAILACLKAGVRFKATAGLHHPVRCYHESVRAHMYGFFNLFGGAVLAATHHFDEATLRTLLLDDNAAHFHFHDDAFVWNGYSASLNAIRRVRTEYAISFGSCSFDEPREDLRALGLL
ncbi:MAG: hypothetical protein ACE5G0_00810 [Rhodothermales bacterium]